MTQKHFIYQSPCLAAHGLHEMGFIHFILDIHISIYLRKTHIYLFKTNLNLNLNWAGLWPVYSTIQIIWFDFKCPIVRSCLSPCRSEQIWSEQIWSESAQTATTQNFMFSAKLSDQILIRSKSDQFLSRIKLWNWAESASLHIYVFYFV